MAAGDLLDGPWQVELREVLMDGCDTTAGLILTEPPSGLGVPPTRNADVERPMGHGLFASPQYLGGRQVLFSVVAQGATYAAMLAEQVELGRAMAPVVDTDADRVIELAFTLGDAAQAYLMFVKPIQAAFGYVVTARIGATATKQWTDAALCEVLATDPRVYGLTLQSAAAGVGSLTGGWGWVGGGAAPLGGWPHGWGSATPGSASCTNAGNFQTYPTITISAGASSFANPSLGNTTTGLAWSIALTIAAGDTLVIDMKEQTALLNGTADRAAFVNRPGSDWWPLEPGANTVTLGGTGATGTATIEWRDAWLL